MISQSIYTEYANITPEHKTWLDGCGAEWLQGERFRQFPIFYSKIVFDGKYFYNYDVPSMTRPCAKTGSEFCERVAEILGIEKPVFGDKFIKAFEPNEEEINKGIDKAEKEWQAKDKVGEDLKEFGIPIQPTHPHRTYRVLDSLDVIPFDTRMPLSEWIPPMGAEVIFIVKNEVIPGHVKSIGYNHCIVWAKTNKEEYVPLDGHWMRIV